MTQEEMMSSTIPKDYGLSLFIKKVYIYLGASILFVLTFAYLSQEVAREFPLEFLYISCLFLLGSVIAINCTKYMLNVKKENCCVVYKSINPTYRNIAYLLTIISSGMMLSLVVGLTDHDIYLKAIGITLVIMGSTIYYAYQQPNGSLLKWRGPLYSCLFTLCFFGLISSLSYMYIGHKERKSDQ